MSTEKGFQYYCETDAIINCDDRAAYQALFKLEDWTKFLPHIQAINVLYDDGRYQEFTMTVVSEKDAGTLTVRSVRLCDGDKGTISFFQPEPPKFLTHHAGGWQFIPIDDQTCQVITFHNWNLQEEKAAAMFSEGDYEQRVADLLLNHAKFALGNWKRVLENPSIIVESVA
ncbi:MAG: hypothetical protein IM473_14620 [Microcystis sp. M015S2]|uniref:hypothetical protein n=1 Tax=unclassified Microcystis TaxID=2643300 RepID=UPI002589BDE7|nr:MULTISPECIES: hypothetical protein [unclassified Microcystis]MCA2711299.1 hypothetical protein [Microcystis sp. M025S2]MCA2743596.1 hypothetical protein [Microcystis sp. M015S2]MCA2757717.1 hypothetical protein [Microcystis sp. M145S2]